MKIFPAIDLYEGKVVRLFRGDYSQMTVYGADPSAVAESFAEQGAEYLHAVDLEGAKTGLTPNLSVVAELVARSGLKTEIGGGVRSEETVKRYLDAGVWRVILGTAAVENPGFVGEMAAKYGEKIAVGVDLRDGLVAIKGWTETSGVGCFDFCRKLREQGVKSAICTDISRDGALGGTNTELYRALTRELDMNFVASGGVSSLEDIRALSALGLYGAILGKALYEKKLDLREALAAAEEEGS